MRRAALFVLAALWLPGPLAAQESTAEQLRQARVLYDRLELERSLRLLRAIVSPGWEAPVTPAERVQAYQYLGATFVLLGRIDSGVVYFRAALERDPFTDLSSDEFTPDQVSAFTRARRETFALATRPVTAGRIDPRTERVRFPFATTHSASVRAELRRGDSVAAVFEVGSQGLAELVWDGLSGGRIAPPGRYELRIRAVSRRLAGRQDSASTYFDLAHDVPALEDTLRTLGPTDLLPERTSASAGLRELGKGAGVAASVFVIAGSLSSGALGRENAAKPAVVASAALVAGVVAFIAQRKPRDIPANIAANAHRRDEWRALDDSIRTRNARRLAATILVMTPAAGVGP